METFLAHFVNMNDASTYLAYLQFVYRAQWIVWAIGTLSIPLNVLLLDNMVWYSRPLREHQEQTRKVNA